MLGGSLGRASRMLAQRAAPPRPCRVPHAALRMSGASLSTPAAPAAVVPSAAAGASSEAAASSAAEKADWRPWPMRNPISTLFLTLASSWAYTLWVGNRTRNLQDQIEEEVKGRYPINEDEMLELRALNDASMDAITSLPKAAAAAGTPGSVRADQLMLLLRRAISAGQPLKEEYALERVLMAMPSARGAAEGPEGEVLDIHVAASALAILSTGPVGERLAAMFELLADAPPMEGDGSAGGGATAASSAANTSSRTAASVDQATVSVERFTALLNALMATGQLPPDKLVHTLDEGRNDVLRIERSWYRIPPVREWTAEEWADALLAPARPPTTDSAAAESSAPAAASGGGLADGSSDAQERSIGLERFTHMLTSDMVCIWGECDRIAERKRLQKQQAEAEEAERNPPFYVRAWRTVRGQGGAPPSGATDAASS